MYCKGNFLMLNGNKRSIKTMELRLLKYTDLQVRVNWMNDSRINQTLNIVLPVTFESTEEWFNRIQTNVTREDYAFVEGDTLVAMGGFTEIDKSVNKAELYIFVNPNLLGKGIGTIACTLLCQYGFEKIGLKKIYLHTNSDNIAARKLYERLGFQLEGFMRNEIMNNNILKDRCYYSLYPSSAISNYKSPCINSPENFFLCQDIQVEGVNLKIVRDDLFPLVGGGNKGRKAIEYEKELINLGCNAIVTTGGIQSNHNRAMALIAAKNNWKCHLVYHGKEERFLQEKGNALLVRKTAAAVEFVDANNIGPSMDVAMENLQKEGWNPYYVTGGGHDIPGGRAFVKAIEQLYVYGVQNNYKPDYIFHASGTGSTQAGILVGLEKVGWGDVKVIGISVARQQERGKEVIIEFANKLAQSLNLGIVDFTDRVYFCTDYLCGGYEKYTEAMNKYIDNIMSQTGIFFDTTYSGKAFWGMLDIVKKNMVNGNILFWHTGGLMNMQK